MPESAPIRSKNPGAMWGISGGRPGPEKFHPTTAPIPRKWGSKKTEYLSDGTGQGNNIAIFDTWLQGLCAQLDLWRTSAYYRNKRFDEAIHKWSGGNHAPDYIAFVKKRVPGIQNGTILNDEFWKGPMGIPFLKAQAWHEAGKPCPAPEGDWAEARRIVFTGVAVKKAAAGGAVAAGTGGAVAVAVQHGWSWAEIGLTAFIVAGVVTAIVLLVRKFRS